MSTPDSSSAATAPAAVIVLAAGQGTRMKSKLPKIMHQIGGRSMVGHSLAAARTLEPQRLVVVVRHDRDRVVQHVLDFDPQALIADQSDVPGTGSAVLAGLQKLDEDAPLEGTVVVTYGDVPLLTAQTLRQLVSHHDSHDNAVTVLTALHPSPEKYGRILRDDAGNFTDIREFKDATDAERSVNEINSGSTLR